jgi:hypothetical protein
LERTALLCELKSPSRRAMLGAPFFYTALDCAGVRKLLICNSDIFHFPPGNATLLARFHGSTIQRFNVTKFHFFTLIYLYPVRWALIRP